MEYLLFDINPAMTLAWEHFFSDIGNVTILQKDVAKISCDALVSPANSFGFMDGGIDYAISMRLGWDLQFSLQEKIRHLPEGELLIGQAMVLKTAIKEIPYLISAPTMRVPMSFNIPTSINAYLAMKATLIAARKHPKINLVAIPGFCTGCGKMDYEIAAQEMFVAFKEIELGEKLELHHFSEAQKQHLSINPKGNIWDV